MVQAFPISHMKAYQTAADI